MQVAIDFAKEHPGETLILVTGDHETGGLTIGFAGTDYDTYLSLLDSQKISFARFDSDYVSAYKGYHHITLIYIPITFIIGILISIMSLNFILVFRPKKGSIINPVDGYL